MKKSSFWFMPFILLMAVIFFSGCSKEVNSTIDDDNAPAGKYTILAYKDGVQKAKWVLNYNGSTYTMAEGNAEHYLPAGTYKFYAFSDKVSFADGKIVKSLTNASENALYFEGDYILCVR